MNACHFTPVFHNIRPINKCGSWRLVGSPTVERQSLWTGKLSMLHLTAPTQSTYWLYYLDFTNKNSPQMIKFFTLNQLYPFHEQAYISHCFLSCLWRVRSFLNQWMPFSLSSFWSSHASNGDLLGLHMKNMLHMRRARSRTKWVPKRAEFLTVCTDTCACRCVNTDQWANSTTSSSCSEV